MSDSLKMYDDDYNGDEVRRNMQSGLQRGIDNLFNRIRQLEIVDVKRKHDLEQHISADREHLLHNLSLSEDLRIWLETIDARLSSLENAIKLDDILELANRVTALEGKATPAPTKRQQVAEAFLHAAETFSLDTEGLYEDLAERIDAQTRKPGTLPRERAMFTAMAAVLEEAVREERDA